MTVTRALVLSLLTSAVAAGCERPKPVAVRDASASDAASYEGATAPVLPKSLDAARVKAAYQALVAGDVAAAKPLFEALALPVSTVVPSAVLLPPGARRALVAVDATCVSGDVGVERCHDVTQRAGGSCAGGTLTGPCGHVVVDVDDGRVRAFFGPGEARAWGRYLVTYPDSGASSVLRLDTLEQLARVDGQIVGAIAGGTKLVTMSAAGKSPAFADVRVVDVEAHAASPPCRVRRALPLQDAKRLRYLAASNRLVIEDGGSNSTISLCDVASGRALAAFSVRGRSAALLDASEKTLYVSGVPAAALVDHYAVDVMSGAAERVRTGEVTGATHGRALALTPDEKTLIVGTHDKIQFFATKPLRVLSPLALDAQPMDSSYDATPALTILPDGKTLLATYNPDSANAALGALEGLEPHAPPPSEVWIFSLVGRELSYRGRTSRGWYTDPAAPRGGMVIDASKPRKERLVLVATAAGLAFRVLAPGEGDATGERLPAELENMHPPVLTFVEERLQTPIAAMCSLGGLPAPRALCPAPRK